MQKLILTVAVALIFLYAGAQTNKDELQKQRQQLRKEIEETEKILNETKKPQRKTWGNYH